MILRARKLMSMFNLLINEPINKPANKLIYDHTIELNQESAYRARSEACFNKLNIPDLDLNLFIKEA